MSARKLFEAGYEDLVSVVPPDATISESSSLSPETRGKVPGKQRLDGTWVGYPWLKEDPPTPSDVAQWESWGANIGLRADHFPGLDVDVDEPQLAQFVVQEAQKLLGTAPIRTSKEPRKLLVYRTDEPFTRISASITYRGEEHTVEMLGEGRQYLVHGAHPSGSDYGWRGKPLWEHDPATLSTVTSADVLDFFTHLQKRLGGRAQVEIQGTGETKDTTAPSQDELKAPSLTDLRSVVAKIPNDYQSRDDYISVGCAIKAAGGEEAFDVFLEWAERWTGGTNEPETVRSDWARMHPPFRVGWEYLQGLAEERSDYVAAQDVFEADPKGQSQGVDPPENNSQGLIALTDSWLVEQIARRLEPKARFLPETSRWHIWGEG